MYIPAHKFHKKPHHEPPNKFWKSAIMPVSKGDDLVKTAVSKRDRLERGEMEINEAERSIYSHKIVQAYHPAIAERTMIVASLLFVSTSAFGSETEFTGTAIVKSPLTDMSL